MTTRLAPTRPPGQLDVEKARTLLAKCRDVDEAKRIRDQAAALQVYARKRKAADESVIDAAEIKVRAERRIGELTKAMEKVDKATAAKMRKDRAGPAAGAAKREALKRAGLSTQEASRCETSADLPERQFESQLKGARESHKPASTRSIIQPVARARREKKLRQQARGNKKLGTSKRYTIIYADPPWKYEHDVTPERSLDNQYPQMTLEEICAMPVRKILTKDAMLFLWVPSPLLRQGLEVIEAWGFDYRTHLVWLKDKIGMGYYVRQKHELLFLAAHGQPITPRPKARPPSVIEAPRSKIHSKKPERFYTIIEKAYPNLSKIELFARKKRKGWASFGNEIDS